MLEFWKDSYAESPDSQQSQLGGKADYDVKNCVDREGLCEVCVVLPIMRVPNSVIILL